MKPSQLLARCPRTERSMLSAMVARPTSPPLDVCIGDSPAPVRGLSRAAQGPPASVSARRFRGPEEDLRDPVRASYAHGAGQAQGDNEDGGAGGGRSRPDTRVPPIARGWSTEGLKAEQMAMVRVDAAEDDTIEGISVDQDGNLKAEVCGSGVPTPERLHFPRPQPADRWKEHHRALGPSGSVPPAASGRRVAAEHQRNEGGFLARDPSETGAAGGLQAMARR